MVINTIDTRIEMYNKLPKNGIGAEIGVCRGANAAHLYMCAKPKILYLVDLWEEEANTKINHPIELHYDNWFNDVQSIFSYNIGKDVFMYKGNSLKFLSTLKDDFLDWIYIDGDHSYDSVSKELDLAVKKVKNGGIIAGHDFTFHKHWKSGVMLSVIEKIQLGKLRMEYLTNEEFPSYFCRVI